MLKPSDTCWLSRERAVHAIRRSLPALLTTFEEIVDETGDAEAHGIASLLTKYNTVACIYMLSDVLHNVAKLQGSLQGKEVDLASGPGMVESTLERLKELKEDTNTTTWFKSHSAVFTDPAQLGERRSRIECTDLISSMAVFDHRQLPDDEDDLSDYGTDKITHLLPSIVLCKKCNLMGIKVFHSPILTQKTQNLSGSFSPDYAHAA